MRRQSLVAGVVLTAAFATLVALPGAAGSQTPSSARPLTADAFQAVRLPASDDGSLPAIRPLDAGFESAGHLDDSAALIDQGGDPASTERVAVTLPVPVLHTERAAAAPTPKPAATHAPARHTPAKTTATPTHRPAPVTHTTSAPTSGYRRVLVGLASWYDNGTTAMRLPRGTHIRICGARGCVDQIVRDWGPAAYLSNRVVDMIPSDFVRVTGKSLGAGLAPVKVYIY